MRRTMSKEQEQCSICSCPFDLEEDGGISGSFGMIPVAYCSTSKVGIHDNADIYWGLASEEEDE